MTDEQKLQKWAEANGIAWDSVRPLIQDGDVNGFVDQLRYAKQHKSEADRVMVLRVMKGLAQTRIASKGAPDSDHVNFTSYPHVDPPLWLSIMATSPELVVNALRLGGIAVADAGAAQRLLSQAGTRLLPLYGCGSPCGRARCRGFGATGKGCPGHRLERAA